MTSRSTGTCLSCHVTLPLEEMQQALRPDWRPIPDAHNCRDREACYQRLLQLPLPDGRSA